MFQMERAASLETKLEPVDATVDLAATETEKTFERFFAEEHRDLFAALLLLTRDRAEAEEIMQDSFLALWERWPRVSGMENPTGYLYRVAMNRYRSRVRRAATAVRKTLHLQRTDDGPSLESVESREDLSRAIGLLAPRRRAAVVLVDVLEFTSVEAGALLGIKDSTVRVSLKQAREQLKKEMTP
jgi:RNA polymerase sigma-70 factor (ECF subfamily)